MQEKSDKGNTVMRYSPLITGILLAALLALAMVPVHADDIPTVTIGSYTVSPSVLMPGSTGTITIIINNTARSASVTQESGELQSSTYTNIRTNDVNVNIENVHLEGNGIKVLTADFDRVGAIGPGQSISLTFQVVAPDNAGLYYPEVWVDTLGGQSTKYPVLVNVDTPIGIQKQAVLVMASTINGTVSPGDNIPVMLTLTNEGQFLADDIILKVDNVSGDIAPKYTDTYDLGALNANESGTVQVVLLSDIQASPGLVRVPVMISYKAIDGTPVTQPANIDLVLEGKAELGIVSVDTNPSPLVDSQPFDFTIRIENTGTGDAKQVAATIDLPAEGTKEAFIGKIKPGDDAPALFLIEGMKGGTYPYNLSVTYTDDLGNHTFVRPMMLRVPPSDNFGDVILGIIILGIIAFLAYRYWYLPRKNSDGMFSWVKKN